MSDQSTPHSSGGRTKKKSEPPKQKATVIALAGVEAAQSSTLASVDQMVLDRIKKCLNRAKHPNTTEFEANTAWKMASKLMLDHNVTQVDVLGQAKEDESLAQLGGESLVAITHMKTPDKVKAQGWVGGIARAMTTLFNCASYSTKRAYSIEWTFYGIAVNTAPAAMAFEMAHNLALEWASARKGPKFDYCMGIGDGLVRIARDEKKAEEKRAKEVEKAEAEDYVTPISTQAAPQTAVNNKMLDQGPREDDPVTGYGIKYDEDTRIKLDDDDGSSSVPDLDFDDGLDAIMDADDDASDDDAFNATTTFKEEDDQAIDLTGDFDDELQKMMPKMEDFDESKASIDGEADVNSPKEIWFTSQALVHFRQTARQVAEEYLKEKNIKLGEPA